MIFYFSGTGNSLYIAKNIRQQLQESIISIASAMHNENEAYEYILKDDEIIGFIFPVYAWAPPKMVLEFIKRLKFRNYNNHYIFAVATCGDNIGNTMKVLESSLKKNKLSLKSGFSIQMPNNYILLGNIDKKEVEKQKLLKEEDTLNEINKKIAARKEGVYEVEKGWMPGMLTSIINPLFNHMGINTKKFYATDQCNRCGLCEKVCNSKTINLQEKPIWGENCTQCLACVNLCPTKAIQYGKSTENKGRYKHPDIHINELKLIR
jgi:ferredoxin